MNEILQNSLIEILNKTINGIDASVSFLQAEIPDVVSQLLTWYAVKGVLLATTGVLLLIAYAVLVKKAVDPKPDEGTNIFWERWGHKDNAEFSPGWCFILGAVGMFVSIFSLLMISNILDTLQIVVAPKIWLIEYASSLIK
ncbi:TMhelix containing protein [Vibrio phage 1.271.B._10N.286.54.B4]|nr:TMhelix containing protein [Vibrio phage 1.027.O._10N.286.54.B8]AUR92391.1 TMhelix containing protein [Vibrio phage 1.171.O._10N.261.52.F12]AUR94444.1 TMhelix containing protein [Vibrio phage 1.194.O._10N.286.54.B1]AUR94532.1 TMhelix containing protein [Vibrio phage 1.195.O._10N.286.54.C8]AUR94617.1 TMhelix containing protein [Vibrio phage 1.196.O._10N.286.54.E12]AUR95084.1 TMhelix containing protein [Vibrio phage 1.200.O._10N.286.55.E1]AUR99572.1 TMhelix containing protein [Vibrio phage 1